MVALTYGSSEEHSDPAAPQAVHPKPQIMVIDEDVGASTESTMALAARGYEPIIIDARDAVQRYLNERPAAVVLDLSVHNVALGLSALRAFKAIDRQVPVIIVSTQGLTRSAIEAMVIGAASLIRKPARPEELIDRIKRVLEEREWNRSTASLSDFIQHDPRYARFLGQSSRMAEIVELSERAGNSDDSVLIQGERGTGKELVARAIAALSSRGKTPFIRVDCAAIGADLLEAQLFGLDDGTFTDPSTMHRKPGAFLSAQQGTLFLEEVGAFPQSLQARLLRVLENGAFRQLGGENQSRARVIGATARDLNKAAAEGRFSQDLLLRLSVISISLPALRDRREDIPALSEYYLEKYAAQQRKPPPVLDSAVVARLTEHEWSGNFREFENVLKRAVALGPDFSVDKELAHKPRRSQERSSSRVPLIREAGRAVARDSAEGRNVLTESAPNAQVAKCSLKAISREAARRAERDLILRVLQRTHWNRKAAAGLLQISYKALLYKIKENGLDDDTW